MPARKKIPEAGCKQFPAAYKEFAGDGAMPRAGDKFPTDAACTQFIPPTGTVADGPSSTRQPRPYTRYGNRRSTDCSGVQEAMARLSNSRFRAWACRNSASYPLAAKLLHFKQHE